MATTRRGLFRALAGVMVGAPLARTLPAPREAVTTYHEWPSATVANGIRIDNRLYIDGREITTSVVRHLREEAKRHSIRPL